MNVIKTDLTKKQEQIDVQKWTEDLLTYDSNNYVLKFLIFSHDALIKQ